MSKVHITLGQSMLPILKAMVARGIDTPHAANTITTDVITAMGGDGLGPAEKAAARSAIANGAHQLRQRLCLTSVDRAWLLTPLGVEIANEKAPIPKAPPAGSAPVRVNVSRKDGTIPPAGSAPVRVNVSRKDGTIPPAEVPTSSEPPPARTAIHPGAAPDVVMPVIPPNPVPTTSPLVAAVSLVQRANAQNWVHDTTLRELVIANQPCFASWDPQNPECGACVVAQYCRQGLGAAMSVLADRLSSEEVMEATKNLREAMGTALSPTLPRVRADLVPGRVMIAPNDGVSVRSGKGYKKGDRVIYLPDEGPMLADEQSS